MSRVAGHSVKSIKHKISIGSFFYIRSLIGGLWIGDPLTCHLNTQNEKFPVSNKIKSKVLYLLGIVELYL